MPRQIPRILTVHYEKGRHASGAQIPVLPVEQNVGPQELHGGARDLLIEPDPVPDALRDRLYDLPDLQVIGLGVFRNRPQEFRGRHAPHQAQAQGHHGLVSDASPHFEIHL